MGEPLNLDPQRSESLNLVSLGVTTDMGVGCWNRKENVVDLLEKALAKICKTSCNASCRQMAASGTVIVKWMNSRMLDKSINGIQKARCVQLQW